MITDCSGHQGICPTPYQLGMHQMVSDGSPYDFNKRLQCKHCINKMWEFRWSLCDEYGWEQWPEALAGVYEMRYR